MRSITGTSTAAMLAVTATISFANAGPGFDHVAGLVIASPDDAKKPIYGLPSVLEDIQGTYFNWEAWPNFGSSGKEPQLKKYELTALTPSEPRDLSGTAMQVTAYPLSHG